MDHAAQPGVAGVFLQALVAVQLHIDHRGLDGVDTART